MSRQGGARVLAAACLLSGAAALVYEVLWVRQLTLVLGNTVAAVSTVLATFMGGLGVGSALAARMVDTLPARRLRRAYAVLEGGIALSALALPISLRAATPLLAGLLRASASSPALPVARLAACALLLSVPTILMGATLPALVALSRPRPGAVGRLAGRLYALNTLGAVTGSLAAGVFMLPALGMARANLAAVSLNVAAGLLVLLAFRAPDEEPSSVPPREPMRVRPAKHGKREPPAPEGLAPAVVLAIIALSGLGALVDEVAWTRALILLMGPTTYAFSFVVAAVIAGIALGSALAAGPADRLARPATSLGAVETAASLASLAVVHVIGRLTLPWGEIVRASADHMDRLLGLELAGVAVLLLLPCLLFGAAFPLAVSLLAGAAHTPGRAAGRAYAWNTAGAIAGALLGGFVALPVLGLQGALAAAAAVHALAGGIALLAVKRGALRLAAAAATLAACGLLPRLRPWDRELLSGGVYKYAPYAQPGALEDSLRAGDLVYYREGRTATVSVKRLGGTLSLAIDGKVDATSSGDMLTQRLLAHVPLLLHPAPRRVCVIGLGSGVTAGSALAHAVESVEAVEISPEVVEASRLFRDVNRDALADPRLRLIVADGRNHLLLATRPYDVIISEPSNPWMAGVSSLFTREFFHLARQRLAAGGLFCQWAHVYNMSEADLRTVVAGFTDVFPDASLFLLNEGDVLLVGAAPPRPAVTAADLQSRLERPSVKEDLAGVFLTSAFAFASLHALDTPALSRWAQDAPRHTDDRPVLEFHAPRFLHANTGPENQARLREAARQAPAVEPYGSLIAHPGATQLAERARMLEQSQSFAWAFETYGAALDVDQRLLPAAEGLVRSALRLGWAARAETALRARAEAAPLESSVALALLYDNLDRPKDALAEIERALRLDPRHLRALLLGAEIQEGAGDLDAVEALAGAVLAVEPDNSDALGLLAAASLGRGRVEEAARRAEAVLARDPDAPRALEVAAIARAERGDSTGARLMFERLVRAEPDAWGHLNNFGVFEMNSGNPARATALFESAIDLNPRNVAGLVGLREAARAGGDLRRAAQAEARLRTLPQ